MLAGMFIYGGLDALRDPEGKAKVADEVAPMIAAALRLPTTDTVKLVRINGGVQVVAGTMLALGKGRRLSAVVLAASLVPTTYAGHRFWEEVDEERRAQQRIQFLKNVAMLGGLVLAAGDTGGRPSVPWVARRAAKQAIGATVAAGVATEEAAKHALETTRSATQNAGRVATKSAKAAAKGARGSKRSRRSARNSAKNTLQGARDAAASVVTAASSRAADLSEQAAHVAHAARSSDVGADLTKRARKAAKKARKIDLAAEVHNLTKAAKKSELSRRAQKAIKQAAKQAAKKAKKAKKAKGADLADQAFKATRKAAQKAAKKAEAQRAVLAKRAERASKSARRKAPDVGVVPHLSAAAGKVQATAHDAIDRARDMAGDVASNGAVERVAGQAHVMAARAADALPVG
jgi:uncharacterized membrane protein YphA (DoxX/SURF4 family)